MNQMKIELDIFLVMLVVMVEVLSMKLMTNLTHTQAEKSIEMN